MRDVDGRCEHGAVAASRRTASPLVRGLAVAGAVVLLAVGARLAGGAVGGDGRAGQLEVLDGLPTPTPRLTPPPLPEAPVDWRLLPEAPVETRRDHVAAWTGDRLVVWGGTTPHPDDRARRIASDGAALDPGTGTWTLTASGPLGPRAAAAATWTGNELFVWGGHNRVSRRWDGAAYNPRANGWRPLPDAPLSARSGAVAVWTGREVVVLGGEDNSGPLTGVASWDPAGNAWRALPDLPEPAAELQAVATTRGVVAWSAVPGPAGATPPPRHLDVRRGVWTPLPPLPRGWTVVAVVEAGASGTLYAAAAAEDGGVHLRAFALPLGARTWHAQSGSEGLALADPRAHWTDAGLLVLASSGAAAGRLYDPLADTWASVPAGPGPPEAGGWTQTWTGEELLLFGGWGRETVRQPPVRALDPLRSP